MLLCRRAGEHGLKLCGLHVLDTLRLEKAYRHWSHDITDEDTPRQAGLMFAVKTKKPESRFGPFIGRKAVLQNKEKPLDRRLVQFLLKDPEPLLLHNEPILRNGQTVGYLASGGYGHYLGASVGLGYVNIPQGEGLGFIKDGSFEIEIAGERHSAVASLLPLYDSKSERIRS